MSNPLEERLAEALAEFEETRGRLDAAAAEAAAISVTVTAKDRAVEATVGAQGELTGLRFPTSRYRTMAPAELANVVMTTIASARAQAASQLLDVYRPFGPIPGLSADAPGGFGPVDWEDLFAPLREDADLVVPSSRSATASSSGGALLDELVDDEDGGTGTAAGAGR
ncbi:MULTISPECIES: YbaB/EbfC family nucleoid-associated protein [unclassified Streptomyces]|uniref:YbaB/EbfC family nucleoid-associated protein n=1 Tax=unclassified Streptomyces TaxID=2593676 RepID=UPI000DC76FB5|nr:MULTISPECIES: YbaB/EbfC family nucleoid-associated protein [unclassified Streptomyces]AWZ05304.1 YbaB/EbfC family DNA-binding protein [Streptomyces sp. ICC4]AWZ11448.1 YbaB/EbfC family DNA-binding protein [Streptomyces sp. ICC1]